MDLTQHFVESDANDYSCYVYIKNSSDQALLLVDCGIIGRYGEWPDGQPPNTVEAGTQGKVWLKDPKFAGGSEGWVLYEVMVGDKKETFKLEFACPHAPWSDNYLHGNSSKPKRLSLDVKPYSSSGHPFTGNVEVWTTPDAKDVDSEELLTTASKTSWSDHHSPTTIANGGVRGCYDIGFDGAGGLAKKSPVHETIAIAAFIRSKISIPPFPPGAKYSNLNPKQWEYFRGMIWNDDPSCYLFDDDANNSKKFSSGAAWLADFKYGDPNCMIQRSHFGNLQFLHAMGAEYGEKPAVTQAKSLEWMGVMYKLACGNQGVNAQDKLGERLPNYFGDSATPLASQTLQDLILASTTKYRSTNIQSRALGICIHMIQDSYSIGHTRRRLTNPHDLAGRDDDGQLRFQPGKYGNWGPVLIFHTYHGQNASKHAWYDGLENGALPNPKDLDSFNKVLGARNAIDACIKLMDAFAQKLSWDDKVMSMVEREILALDPDAKDSDDKVDEYGVSSTDRAEYDSLLQQKLLGLEHGLSSPAEFALQQHKSCGRRHSLVYTILVLMLATCAAGIWLSHLHFAGLSWTWNQSL